MSWRPTGKQWATIWIGFAVSASLIIRSLGDDHIVDLEREFGIYLTKAQEIAIGAAALIATGLVVLGLQPRDRR